MIWSVGQYCIWRTRGNKWKGLKLVCDGHGYIGTKSNAKRISKPTITYFIILHKFSFWHFWTKFTTITSLLFQFMHLICHYFIIFYYFFNILCSFLPSFLNWVSHVCLFVWYISPWDFPPSVHVILNLLLLLYVLFSYWPSSYSYFFKKKIVNLSGEHW